MQQESSKIRQSASTNRVEYQNPTPARSNTLRANERLHDRFEDPRSRVSSKLVSNTDLYAKRTSYGHEENVIPRSGKHKSSKAEKKHLFDTEEKQVQEPFKSRHLQNRIEDEDSYDRKYSGKNRMPKKNEQKDGQKYQQERKADKNPKKSQRYLEDEREDGVSCYEALSCTSQLCFNKSQAGSVAGKSDMSHLSYNTWNDNKSLASFASEHTIIATKKIAKKRFTHAQELVNLDKETIAKIRERSRSRDIRGHRIKSITGVEIPLNEPMAVEISDEESDFEVDMGKIATNIPNLGSHTLHKLSQHAEFNPPQEKKIREMREKIRHQGLKGRNIKNKKKIDDDFFDKENEHGNANFVTIQKGLRTGHVKYQNLKFNRDQLNLIDTSQWEDEDFVNPKKGIESALDSSSRFDSQLKSSSVVKRLH